MHALYGLRSSVTFYLYFHFAHLPSLEISLSLYQYLFVVLVVSHLSFGGTLVLIAPIPDHYFSFNMFALYLLPGMKICTN